MKSIKKIGKAFAGTALLIGASIAGGAGLAAAQNQNQTDLGDYPQPFITDDGEVDTSIVIGESARTIDVIGGMNIAGGLGVDVGSQLAGTTVQSSDWQATNGVTLDTRNDPLFFLDQLDEVRETITEDELGQLQEVTFRDDGGDETDIEFFMYPGNQEITYGLPDDADSDEDPFLHVENPEDVDDDDFLYQLQANFEDDVDFTDEEVQDEDIDLFGMPFTVSTDTTSDELVLLGSQEEFDIETGEEQTITVNEEEHTIEVQAVTSSETAAFRVDGELQERDEDDTFTIDGQEVRLSDVIQTNSDNSQGFVTFAIGSQELVFENNQPIQDDDGDDIDGSYVQLNGGSNSNVSELSSISVYVGSDDDDQEFIRADESYSHPAFEDFEFHFGGLNPDAAESQSGTYEISTSGDDTVSAQFTSDRGDDTTVEFAHSPDPDISNPELNLADNDNDSIHPYEGAEVAEDEYFPSDAGDFAHMWEVTNIDVDAQSPSSGDEATADLSDVSSGNTVEVDLDAEGSVYEGTEVIDGQTYRFQLDPQGANTEDVLQTYWGDGSTTSSPGDSQSVYPALDTDSRASTTFTDIVSISQSDTTSRVYELPTTESTDESEVNITVDYTATDAISATAISGTNVVEDGSDDDVRVQVNNGATFEFTANDTDNEVDITPWDGSSRVMDPAAALIEPENDADDEEVYWEVPSVDTGDDEVDVNSPIYTGDRRTEELESDDDTTAGYDIYGGYSLYDSDSQGSLTLNIPPSQSTAGAAFTGMDGSISASGGNGSAGGATTTADTWPDDATALDSDQNIGNLRQNSDLILVGGPSVNNLVQDLADQNETWTSDQYSQGESLIQLVEDGFTDGNHALIVAGFAGEDTRQAANFLSNYAENTDELAGQDMVTLDTESNSVQDTDNETDQSPGTQSENNQSLDGSETNQSENNDTDINQSFGTQSEDNETINDSETNITANESINSSEEDNSTTN